MPQVDGNRVPETQAGVTTEYLVDMMNPTGLPQVVDEVVNGSVTRTYAYGLQRISENQQISGTWTPSFYGYDGHGNVRFLANTSGTVGNTYQFDAFGNQIASTGTTPNSFLYSGEQFDSSTSMYQLRARWYRPTTGRFTTRDPVEGQACSPLTLSSYVYAGDDPVDMVDPTGEQAILEYALLLHFVAPPKVTYCLCELTRQKSGGRMGDRCYYQCNNCPVPEASFNLTWMRTSPNNLSCNRRGGCAHGVTIRVETTSSGKSTYELDKCLYD